MKRFFLEINGTKKKADRHHISFWMEDEIFKFIEKLVRESGMSRNYILNKCLEFVLDNYGGINNYIMSGSEGNEIYADIFNDTATITIYSDAVRESSILDVSKLFESNFPEIKISGISMVKNELFISFPLPGGWRKKDVERIAEDISTRL